MQFGKDDNVKLTKERNRIAEEKKMLEQIEEDIAKKREIGDTEFLSTAARNASEH